MLNALDQKLFDNKFVEFLIEREIHPSHLLKLTQQINSGKILNEGIFSSIYGGLKSLYHGLKAGYKTTDVERAKTILKDQLISAYKMFASSIEKMTGSKTDAQKILTNLKNNTDSFIDDAMSSITLPTTTPPPATPAAPPATPAAPPATPAAPPATPAAPKSSPTKPSLRDIERWDTDILKMPTTQPVRGLLTTDLDPKEKRKKEEEKEGLNLALRELPKEKETGNQKTKKYEIENEFVKNYDNFVETMLDAFKRNEYFDENKFPFSAFLLVKRLYKYKPVPFQRTGSYEQHPRNMKYLGIKNWKTIASKIMEIFKSHNCNFNDENYTDEITKNLNDMLSVNGSSYYMGIFGDLKKSSIKWKDLLQSLNEIEKYIKSFCKDNPKKCDEIGKGGTEKMLKKLKETKNLNFSNWLIMKENILF
jgi:hypothetical protein